MRSNQPQTHSNVVEFISNFPRQHLMLAIVALSLICAALFLAPTKDAQAKRVHNPVPLTLVEETPIIVEANDITEELAANDSIEAEILEASTDSAIEEEFTNEVASSNIVESSESFIQQDWKTATVKKGDSLSTLFSRAGIPQKELYHLLKSSSQAKKLLSRIYPGQKLKFHADDNNQLTSISYQRDKLNSTLIERTEQGYSLTEKSIKPEVRTRYASAVISSSLYIAARRADLPQNLVMELANVFGGVIDFVYDVRSNDSFNVMFEEHYVDGERVGTGPILAAEFTNRGETHKAFRYHYENGDIGYFSPEGVSMRKAFLRAPVDFTRISSGFNPNRLHPIFKTARPHRGIDYAAPTGTPVFSAGDGRIVASGYNKASGNYVVVKHGPQYTTKYLHLNKRAVKKGTRVKQQQIIGWVGSTGYATGPHLHYEFLVNGVHRNPRTILKKLPKAVSIAKTELPRFKQQISGLQTQLATYQQSNQFASAESNRLSSTL